jgi:hypothetical protein
MGTSWEHIENKEKKIPSPPSSKRKNNWISHECMLSLLIDCMKLLFSKTIHHHFWPGLMAGAETMVQSLHQLPWV